MKSIQSVLILAAILLLVTVTAFAAPNIDMVRVPGGCFQMGYGVKYNKLHLVCVDDFFIGKYEITQAQWQAVMGKNPSRYKECGINCPVDNISFDDVQQFISKLNEETEKKYRLPYEAEWEYAARSGGRDEVWAGNSDQGELEEYAWFEDNSGETMHPVGKKRPNGLGIYDMSGNVSEWCKDWYDEKYYENSPQKNPKGPLSGASRVIRGGSWSYSAGDVRAAYRDNRVPSFRDYHLGFRLVLPSIR